MTGEIWDAYDRDLHRIEGMSLVRGEPIPEGVYHLVSDVIVRHRDGTYLLMRRDPRKSFGGMWEATAGGSALQGEDPRMCAERELREETGIVSGELSEVGRVRDDTNHTIYAEFLCVTGAGKDSVILQEGETADFRWVTREELLRMRRDELVTERMQMYLDELRPGSFRITLYEERYRDGLIRMISEAKKALGREPRIPGDLYDVEGSYFRKGDLFWVAVDPDGRVVGSVGFSRIPGTDEAFLHRLFILPSHKRRGIGMVLLRKAETAMRERGVKTVRVHLGTPDAYFESYSFYPRFGYESYEPRYMKKELR